jgi:hypothetical protein
MNVGISFYTRATAIEAAKIILIIGVLVLCLYTLLLFEFGLAAIHQHDIIFIVFTDSAFPSICALPYAVLSSSSICNSRKMERKSRLAFHLAIYFTFLLLCLTFVNIDDFKFVATGSQWIDFLIMNYAFFVMLLATWLAAQWSLRRSQSW